MSGPYLYFQAGRFFMKTRRKSFVLTLCSVIACTMSLRANWSLPYSRPAQYDYGNYYAQSLNLHLTGKPDFFSSELSKAWSFYKKNFIMANGLVNHKRLVNGSVTGETEAVSEGQGYGMLLALLNNDQATFNNIFEAANTYMWDNSRKSYFYWEWKNGGKTGQGAATDADLDIGLALVFADALAQKGLWDTYSKNGVTYASRAKEVISSIYNNMTRNGYLLPGDNWGGEAINNLNPSYFATAWLKVFNEYQSDVDFTGVIDKCYDVLEKMPRYAQGQAVDWITPNGQRAGRGGLEMGNDAIRTPWRIAMDALWFNDSRAIAYCKNTKGTLTEYNSSNSINFLIAQMGLYNEQGQIIPETKGSFDYVAMWSCGILGSKETSYTTKALEAAVIGKIVGSSSDMLGSSSLQDDKYYYKQSIGALGFAALGGMFPNIFADMQGPITPPEPVKLTSALAPSPTTIDLPGSIAISASLDKDANWTITTVGETSGNSQTFEGSSKSISVTWSGSGYYELETVTATLEVDNLDSTVSPGELTTSFEITQTPPRPVIEPGGALVIHDLENASTINAAGGQWFVYDDAGTNGTSQTEPDDAIDLLSPSGGNPGSGIQVKFTVDQYAGVGMHIIKKGGTVDMSNFESISFDYKTSTISTMLFMLCTANITDFAYHVVSVSGSSNWKTATIKLTDFQPPNWQPNSQMDNTVAEKIQWQVESGNNGTLYLDNVRFNLKSGKLPDAAFLDLLTGPNPVLEHSTANPGVQLSAAWVGSALRISGLESLNGNVQRVHISMFQPDGRMIRKQSVALSATSKELVIDNRAPAGNGYQFVQIDFISDSGGSRARIIEPIVRLR
ncbi:MAG: hypothetical protein GF398_00530 [Chitinivibrionales bacterium]|nr:hypothetical protein [Chitinivibrionales bacterium]